jgi:hypothetical protein
MRACAQTAKKKGKAMKKNKKTTKKQPIQRQSLLADDWLMEEPSPAPLVLRFSPTAWAKLLYFRDRSHNEIGGFGITDPEDLLFVEEFITVEQEVTGVSVKFDDHAVGEFFDAQVDLGRKPEQFARIWCHSHPDISPEPSATDEETFERVFGTCQWAVMFILAQDNTIYARLSFHVGPGGQVLVPTEVDYCEPFGPSDHKTWEAEYCAHVRASVWPNSVPASEIQLVEGQAHGCAVPYDFLAEFEGMDPVQRQLVLDELADRPELWDEEQEVMLL